ncbi:transposase DNA-binding-containing protein [Paraburkholderia sp. BL25I1N1]|uniref:IS4/Tn5 family transposase DNA-binding protein n=1 Tax=Paraburkholderia sp. BL25I1N1 TaxID=1938804 RepID=UPI002159559E|nr:transposase DNA-binding-containing protein [Paraburkholderia sp. BL25I1N1]
MDEEFETLDLGDPRRDRRAKELVKRFASRPTASIPGACEGWAETMVAYRFLGNERIDWRDMMQPHWEPGAKTLWIGMQRVMDAVITIQILRDGYDTSV